MTIQIGMTAINNTCIEIPNSLNCTMNSSINTKIKIMKMKNNG